MVSQRPWQPNNGPICLVFWAFGQRKIIRLAEIPPNTLVDLQPLVESFHHMFEEGLSQDLLQHVADFLPHPPPVDNATTTQSVSNTASCERAHAERQ